MGALGFLPKQGAAGAPGLPHQTSPRERVSDHLPRGGCGEKRGPALPSRDRRGRAPRRRACREAAPPSRPRASARGRREGRAGGARAVGVRGRGAGGKPRAGQALQRAGSPATSLTGPIVPERRAEGPPLCRLIVNRSSEK